MHGVTKNILEFLLKINRDDFAYNEKEIVDFVQDIQYS